MLAMLFLVGEFCRVQSGFVLMAAFSPIGKLHPSGDRFPIVGIYATQLLPSPLTHFAPPRLVHPPPRPRPQVLPCSGPKRGPLSCRLRLHCSASQLERVRSPPCANVHLYVLQGVPLAPKSH